MNGARALLAGCALTGCALAASALLPSPAAAWNASGHMQVAAVAWERLTPPSRARLGALLAKHPRFSEDFVAAMPEEVKQAPQAVRDQWAFLRAAIWPDLARDLPEAIRERYNRPSWHYVNAPIFLGAGARAALAAKVPSVVNLATALPADPENAPLNAAQALALAFAKVRASGTPASDKALYLCWLLHLIGDVHQPLHGAALFAAARFPTGDQGGNAIEIQGRGNLHWLWDGATGSGVDLSYVTRKARDALAQPELAAAGQSAAQAMGFAAWLEESYDLAQSDVYHADVVLAVDQLDRSGKPADLQRTPLVALPQPYFEHMRAVAARRVVEAGYRAAELIRVQLKL